MFLFKTHFSHVIKCKCKSVNQYLQTTFNNQKPSQQMLHMIRECFKNITEIPNCTKSGWIFNLKIHKRTKNDKQHWKPVFECIVLVWILTCTKCKWTWLKSYNPDNNPDNKANQVFIHNQLSVFGSSVVWSSVLEGFWQHAWLMTELFTCTTCLRCLQLVWVMNQHKFAFFFAFKLPFLYRDLISTYNPDSRCMKRLENHFHSNLKAIMSQFFSPITVCME